MKVVPALRAASALRIADLREVLEELLPIVDFATRLALNRLGIVILVEFSPARSSSRDSAYKSSAGNQTVVQVSRARLRIGRRVAQTRRGGWRRLTVLSDKSSIPPPHAPHHESCCAARRPVQTRENTRAFAVSVKNDLPSITKQPARGGWACGILGLCELFSTRCGIPAESCRRGELPAGRISPGISSANASCSANISVICVARRSRMIRYAGERKQVWTCRSRNNPGHRDTKHGRHGDRSRSGANGIQASYGRSLRTWSAEQTGLAWQSVVSEIAAIRQPLALHSWCSARRHTPKIPRYAALLWSAMRVTRPSFEAGTSQFSVD